MHPHPEPDPAHQEPPHEALKKTAEADDPMVLHATRVSGDPYLMLDSLIEEYARMGFSAAKIHGLFKNPGFLATYCLTQRFGEQVVSQRIETVLQRCGVLRVTMTQAPQIPPCSKLAPGPNRSHHDV